MGRVGLDEEGGARVRGAVVSLADLRGADLRMPEELDDARSDGGVS
jgi:hypothetical protein